MRRGISILALAGCATMVCAREEVSRDFLKTVALPAGRSFRIEHSQGNVRIQTHAKPELEIHASIRCSANQANDAKSFCDRIRIAVEETGSGVWVRTEYPHSDLFRGLRNLSYSVNYEVMMPQTAPLEVKNRFGGVTVNNLHAAGTINNSNGSVSFSGGRGRQRIDNAFGSIDVARNDGDLTIVTTNGPVTVSDITGEANIRNRFENIRVTNVGKKLDINSSNGAVSVTDVGGAVAIANSFGGVTVRGAKSDVVVQNENGRVDAVGVTGAADLRTTFESIHFSGIGKQLTVRASNSQVTGDTVGGSATVETSFGGIDLRGVKGGARAVATNSTIRLTDIGGESYAKNSFGGVTIDGAAGPITVENGNGSVTVRPRNTPCQALSLSTTFGPISVTVPPGVGYDVSARTTFGRIHSRPPVTVTGQMGGDSLTGKIGSGGCPMKLNGQNGNIDILN